MADCHTARLLRYNVTHEERSKYFGHLVKVLLFLSFAYERAQNLMPYVRYVAKRLLVNLIHGLYFCPFFVAPFPSKGIKRPSDPISFRHHYQAASVGLLKSHYLLFHKPLTPDN